MSLSTIYLYVYLSVNLFIHLAFPKSNRESIHLLPLSVLVNQSISLIICLLMSVCPSIYSLFHQSINQSFSFFTNPFFIHSCFLPLNFPPPMLLLSTFPSFIQASFLQSFLHPSFPHLSFIHSHLLPLTLPHPSMPSSLNPSSIHASFTLSFLHSNFLSSPFLHSLKPPSLNPSSIHASFPHSSFLHSNLLSLTFLPFKPPFFYLSPASTFPSALPSSRPSPRGVLVSGKVIQRGMISGATKM